MIFQERKKENSYTYDLEDVFGTLHIHSELKLDADMLDDMVVLLLKQTYTAQKIEGEIETPTGKVSYTFTKSSQWEDEEKEPDIQIEEPRTPGWIERFITAFKTAWKNTKK